MTPAAFIRDLAGRITYPDGKPYCRDCGDLEPTAGDGACPHLQARALLAALAEPPDVAAMERRAAAVLRLDTPWPLHETLASLADATDHLLADHSCDGHGYEGIVAACDSAWEIVSADPAGLARDVQTLLAERLRALTALEDAAPDLNMIRERHREDEEAAGNGCVSREDGQQAHEHRAALLGLVNLLALTVAERDERLEAAGRAYSAADLRASEAEAQVAVLRANQEAILDRVREGLYLPEGEYDADWLLNRVATVARLHREAAGTKDADLP